MQDANKPVLDILKLMFPNAVFEDVTKNFFEEPESKYQPIPEQLNMFDPYMFEIGAHAGTDRSYHPVLKPEHYNKNGIEAWDAIKASMTKEEWEGYCKGNTLKYLWRWRYKNGLEDLEKARQYLDKLVESVNGPVKKETQKC